MQVINYSPASKSQVEDIFRIYWTDEEFLNELSDNLESSDCNFYIALNIDEVVGVVGVRKVKNFLLDHTNTDNPCELYIIASKSKNKGVGSALLQHIINECKRMYYTELICYSPETHDSSWRFYEKNGFVSLGIVNDPDDGYPGMVWRRLV
ncbi:MAG: putative acetyltransferase [Patescibacteria group bacterium]|nr:putative acetyltransferase [Patescibacteria group bacterium]